MKYFTRFAVAFVSASLAIFPAVQASAATAKARKASVSHVADEPLVLNSSVALVADADSREVLYAKNPHRVLPIASITKMMAVVVTLEAKLNLDEVVMITADDVDTYKNTHSRLRPGLEFTRRELIHMALMASENRAAAALGRTYPGGMQACAEQMNRRAKQLGMTNTHFVETTGLSVENQSSANDLAHMVLHARRFPLIREFSTDPGASLQTQQGKTFNFHNTNFLVRQGQWDIALQKTGFINEAGRCMVMQARLGGRNLVIVLLDALGSSARTADAERIRRYVSAKLQ
jgi:D-alanyl-D-alanine endopeptidase (penicillin-binding protein 7)